MQKHRVFLAWTLNAGVTFYRFMNFVKYAKKDISFGFSKWKPDFQGVADWEYNIKDPKVGQDLDTLMEACDMVIAQKFHSIGGLAMQDVFRELHPKKPFYTELDDNIFAVNPCSPAYDSYNPGSEAESIVGEQIEKSTGLIVSTEYLKKVYEQLNPNIWVIRNAIDFDIWDKLNMPKKKSKKIVIGWAGGGEHNADLKFILPAVLNTLKNFKNVEFSIIGGVPPEYKDIKGIKTAYKWSPIDKYPQALKDAGFDIGIAPLRDNEFNRAKSNLRWLEYSAMGIPTIASNVEPYKCIKNGNDGLLVSEVNEWEDALAELITREEKRKTIGKNAYNRVKKDFNAKAWGDHYASTIDKILKGRFNVSPHRLIELVNG